MRLICIGDVHGCLEELDELLKLLAPTQEDQIVFLGDLVDKGPDSKGVLRRVREHDKKCITKVLMGNHDKKWARKAQRVEGALPADGLSLDELAWVESFPLFIRVQEPGPLFLVHGGIWPGFYDKCGRLEATDAIWTPQNARGRSVEKLAHCRMVDDAGGFVALSDVKPEHKHWSETYDGREGFAVFGHDPNKKGLRAPHALGIDTGCCYGGALTAAVWTEPMGSVGPAGVWEQTFVDVQAKRVYAEAHDNIGFAAVADARGGR